MSHSKSHLVKRDVTFKFDFWNFDNRMQCSGYYRGIGRVFRYQLLFFSRNYMYYCWNCALFYEFYKYGLTGSFPTTLPTGLASLTYIDVSHNQITSSLPSAIPSGWSSFVFLDVSFNKLTGGLPTSGPSSFTTIHANKNLLSGALSISLIAFTNISISNNFFIGSLPTMTKVVRLYAANNRFTGSFPSTAAIQIVDVTNNSFSGIPVLPSTCLEFHGGFNAFTDINSAAATSLSFVNVTRNAISLISQLPNSVRTIDVSYNVLLKLFLLPLSINTFIANNNAMTGQMLAYILSIYSNMAHVDISNNLLSGSFPIFIKSLVYMDFSFIFW
eukprot:NODE_257_length_11653_cov_0.298858.p4 type:complete len:329 gc:universal NODE_257_length_11653_cov_0.298858:1046-2032(+)